LTELEEDGETQEQQEQPDAVPASESSKKRRRSDVVEATQGDNHKSARVLELERNSEVQNLKHKQSMTDQLERNRSTSLSGWRASVTGRADSVPGEVDASREAGIFTTKVVLYPSM